MSAVYINSWVRNMCVVTLTFALIGILTLLSFLWQISTMIYLFQIIFQLWVLLFYRIVGC